MVAFSDSDFANFDDIETQFGLIIFLSDDTGNANWLIYLSYKCLCVVLSVLAGEIYAFSDLFDAVYVIKHDQQVIFNHHISLAILKDLESLFKVIVKSNVTTEKRLIINIKATREAYGRHEITNIGWIRMKYNVADGLTKLGRCEILEELIDSGSIRVDVKQWIVMKQDNAQVYHKHNDLKSRYSPSNGEECESSSNDNGINSYTTKMSGDTDNVTNRAVRYTADTTTTEHGRANGMDD